jgi:hypothetical protein
VLIKIRKDNFFRLTLRADLSEVSFSEDEYVMHKDTIMDIPFKISQLLVRLLIMNIGQDFFEFKINKIRPIPRIGWVGGK